MTPLPTIGHLAIEWERHTVDLLPASLSCQHGRTDLTDLVTSLFIYLFIFLFLLFIFLFLLFLYSASLLNTGNTEL